MHRQRILRAFRRIHRCEVLHGDIASKHILKHPIDKKPRIIDFEGSLRRTSEDDWSMECDDEMDEVRDLLGLKTKSLAVATGAPLSGVRTCI